MISVGVTPKIADDTELRLMSSEPQLLDQNYFKIEDFPQMTTAVDKIITAVCQVSG